MSDFPPTIGPIQDSENCWKTPREFLALLRRILKITIPDARFGKIWVANGAPPPELSDYVWEKRSSDGKPLGFFRKFGGLWQPVWPSQPDGYIIGFTGDPADVVAPFAVCDGLNGTPDLRHLMCKTGTTTLGTAGGIEASPAAITSTLSYGLKQYVGF